MLRRGSCLSPGFSPVWGSSLCIASTSTKLVSLGLYASHGLQSRFPWPSLVPPPFLITPTQPGHLLGLKTLPPWVESILQRSLAAAACAGMLCLSGWWSAPYPFKSCPTFPVLYPTLFPQGRLLPRSDNSSPFTFSLLLVLFVSFCTWKGKGAVGLVITNKTHLHTLYAFGIYRAGSSSLAWLLLIVSMCPIILRCQK